ncbi:hypothetical protein PROFUN_15538 [Planoprotostelium fungivorum]|uniref:Uncharacterized protein n=1 Tax=Planoprotostelium fungivorum TaxID=1890364 RepID=A0A2P6MUR8_9EUKA|nr:hypothetical protein PROFUN_15538 [Planoprotostelium fungivorum]
MSELVLDLWFLTIYPVGASADFFTKTLPRPFVVQIIEPTKRGSSQSIAQCRFECFFSGNLLTLHEEWAHEAVLPLVLNSQWSSWSQILVASSTTGVEHIVPAEVRTLCMLCLYFDLHAAARPMSELVLDLWFLTIYPVGASADFFTKTRFVLPRPFVDTNKQWSSALRFIFWLSSECFFSGNMLTLHEEWAHEDVLPLVRNREI